MRSYKEDAISPWSKPKRLGSVNEPSASTVRSGSFNSVMKDYANKTRFMDRMIRRILISRSLFVSIWRSRLHSALRSIASSALMLLLRYHALQMDGEAIHTYSLLIRNKHYHDSGRLRVNIGNIYFEQQKYQSAIKM